MRNVGCWLRAGGWLAGLGVAGCSLPANPVTKFGVDPLTRTFYFKDTKDNDLNIKKLVVDPATKAFSVDEVTVRNNSSDVRRANVEQITAYTAQVQAVTQMFQQMTASLAAIVPYARPNTSLSVNPLTGQLAAGSTVVPLAPPAVNSVTAAPVTAAAPPAGTPPDPPPASGPAPERLSVVITDVDAQKDLGFCRLADGTLVVVNGAANQLGQSVTIQVVHRAAGVWVAQIWPPPGG